MACATNALKTDGDGTRRADLADKVNAADVDSEFERSGGDQRADFSGFEFALRGEAQFAREAPVMRGYGIAAEAFGEVVGDAFGQAAGIDEDERGGMLCGELGEAIVDFAPHFVGSDGAELAGRYFDGEIHFAAMADLHDCGVVAFRASQEMSDRLNRFLRGGEADAREALAGELVQALEGESEVRAALVVGYRVNFVDDDSFDGLEDFAALGRGEKDVERFRRGDQDVRRASEHCAALVGEGVSGADGRADFRHEHAAFSRE